MFIKVSTSRGHAGDTRRFVAQRLSARRSTWGRKSRLKQIKLLVHLQHGQRIYDRLPSHQAGTVSRVQVRTDEDLWGLRFWMSFLLWSTSVKLTLQMISRQKCQCVVIALKEFALRRLLNRIHVLLPPLRMSMRAARAKLSNGVGLLCTHL